MEPFGQKPLTPARWAEQKRKHVFCDFYIFGLVDGLGDTIQAPVEDPSDTICLEGYLPEDHPQNPGEHWHFESDAYHLKQWAEENGMKAFKHGYMYKDLPEPSVRYYDGS